MADYVLVTDGTADLPGELFAKLGVEVVPMEFFVNEKPYQHYADAREMSFEEFYRRGEGGGEGSTRPHKYFFF